MNKLINIGYGNLINIEKIVSIVSADSAPAKRLAQKAKDEGRAIDATQGRKTKSIIITDSNHVILSALLSETIGNRSNGAEVEEI